MIRLVCQGKAGMGVQVPFLKTPSRRMLRCFLGKEDSCKLDDSGHVNKVPTSNGT